MTRDEAKRILALYRPWATDADDPEFSEALELTRQDQELGQWFKQHCAAQAALRSRLVKITPPPGLKEQILSERRAGLSLPFWRKPALVATALVIVIAVGVVGGWLTHTLRQSDELNFTAYRSRMVSTALRLYGMDLETNNLAVIQNYLAQHQGRTDYALPKPLTQTTATGCGVLSWQGNPVTMICFHSGQPLPPGTKTDLFLFVMDRKAAEHVPAGASPVFTRVNKLTTASWADGDVVYVLAGTGDEDFLRKFL